MRRCARWTREETAILTREWGDCRKRALREKLPSRTWVAICLQARRLGLPPRDQGRVACARLAWRFGCHLKKLLEVCALAGVRVTKVESEARKPGARHRWLRVDPIAAEHAWRAWCDLESMHAAAIVRGVVPCTFWRWARDAGLTVPGRPGRARVFPSALLDRVAATRGRVTLGPFDLEAYLRAEVARRIAASEREAIRAAQRAGVIQPSPEVRRAS